VLPGIGQSSWMEVMLIIRPPPPCLIICLAAKLGTKKSALQVDFKYFFVLRFGGVENRRARLYPGIVHHDVDMPKFLYRGRNELLQVSQLADVGLHPDQRAPKAMISCSTASCRRRDERRSR
jgi:hypothetical protein